MTPSDSSPTLPRVDAHLPGPGEVWRSKRGSGPVLVTARDKYEVSYDIATNSGGILHCQSMLSPFLEVYERDEDSTYRGLLDTDRAVLHAAIAAAEGDDHEEEREEARFEAAHDPGAHQPDAHRGIGGDGESVDSVGVPGLHEGRLPVDGGLRLAGLRVSLDSDEETIANTRLEREDAARDLLDALAMPDGRNVRAAWDRMCLLHGRFGWAMKRAAFEQYLDELAAGGSR